MCSNWLGRIIAVILPVALSACSTTFTAPPTTAQPSQVAPYSTVVLATEALPSAGSDSPIPEALGSVTRWIEVSLQEQKVRLHADDRIVAEYPAATGVNTKPETTTYPGLFEVRRKYKGPIETAPGVYVIDVLEFDLDHGNGIHSLPRDVEGHILDDRVGTPATAGCVRVAESTAVYDFATPGMKVWVH